MAAVLTSFLRGMVGVAASVLVVAVVWTVYVNRDAVSAAVSPLVALFAADEPAPARPAAPAPASAPERASSGEQPAHAAPAPPGGADTPAAADSPAGAAPAR